MYKSAYFNVSHQVNPCGEWANRTFFPCKLVVQLVNSLTLEIQYGPLMRQLEEDGQNEILEASIKKVQGPSGEFLTTAYAFRQQ